VIPAPRERPLLGRRAGLNDAEIAVIRFLLDDEMRIVRLQNSHIPDGDGSCLGCNSQRRPPPWPCEIRYLADEALLYRLPPVRQAP